MTRSGQGAHRKRTRDRKWELESVLLYAALLSSVQFDISIGVGAIICSIYSSRVVYLFYRSFLLYQMEIFQRFAAE